MIGATKPCPGCQNPIRIGSTTTPAPVAALAASVAVQPDSPFANSPTMQRAIDEALAEERAREAEADGSSISGTIFWPVAMGISVCLIGAMSFYQPVLDGPQFLMVAVLLAAVGMCLTLVAKPMEWGTGRVAVMSLITFELICLIRIMWGQSHGMHKFGFLVGMMVIVPVIAVVGCFGSIGGVGGSGHHSFFSSCSDCGSSCGGGCGGGCGSGCGGCGD